MIGASDPCRCCDGPGRRRQEHGAPTGRCATGRGRGQARDRGARGYRALLAGAIGRAWKRRHCIRNLALVWANYSAAGADRLLLGLLLEQRSDLLTVYEAIPGAEITVVRLNAPLPLIEERVRLREKTTPEAEVSAARWWVSRLERSLVADHVVDHSQRPPREVAADVLRALGWLESAG